MGEFGFDKLNFVDVESVKDVARQFDITPGYDSCAVHAVEWRFDEMATLTAQSLVDR